VIPFEFRKDIWHQKTRIRGLSCGFVCVNQPFETIPACDVSPSHAGIVSKRLKVESRKQSHTSAIAMTLCVLGGHLPIESLYKHNFSYFGELRGFSAFAELLVFLMFAITDHVLYRLYVQRCDCMA